jgi:hypothetical protein
MTATAMAPRPTAGFNANSPLILLTLPFRHAMIIKAWCPTQRVGLMQTERSQIMGDKGGKKDKNKLQKQKKSKQQQVEKKKQDRQQKSIP